MTTDTHDVLFPVSPDRLSQLHDRLEREADADGLIDIAYRTIDSPVGSLLLAQSDRGLVRVAFERQGFDGVLQTLSDRFGSRVLEARRLLDDAARQVDAYFAGRRRSFDLAIDDRLSTGFRRTVQRYLPQIAYGHTLTYGQVAQQVGNPKAVRAVGTACATNPLPIVVPCHRVLRSDGSIGGYAGGADAKAALLGLEHPAA